MNEHQHPVIEIWFLFLPKKWIVDAHGGSSNEYLKLMFDICFLFLPKALAMGTQ